MAACILHDTFGIASPSRTSSGFGSGSKARDPVLCDGKADRGVPIESAKFGKLVELLVYSRLKPERYSDAVLLVTQLEKSNLLSQSAFLHALPPLREDAEW